MRLLPALLACVVVAERHVSNETDALWGFDMHRAMSQVAQGLLTAATATAVRALIPEVNGELWQIATWADDVRPSRPWTAAFHYINVPDWICSYVESRDCPTTEGCVDRAIQNYTNRLANRQLSAFERAEALKYLVHFIGDIHQPMHVGFAGDLGGNRLTGAFFGSNTNLHSLWDGALPLRRVNTAHGGSWRNYASFIASRLTGDLRDRVPGWRTCRVIQGQYGACSNDWAQTSVGRACQNAYVRADGITRLQVGWVEDTPYFDRNWPLAEVAIAEGAVRMANVLNNALSTFADDLLA